MTHSVLHCAICQDPGCSSPQKSGFEPVFEDAGEGHPERGRGIASVALRRGIKWPRPGSNRRHQDFQSCALPTELPGQTNRVRCEQRSQGAFLTGGPTEFKRSARSEPDSCQQIPKTGHKIAEKGHLRSRLEGKNGFFLMQFPLQGLEPSEF